MTIFRPCIDLHNGCVKQIVGGTLSNDEIGLKENFVATQPVEWFAERYQRDGLTGGHVIKLGPGNDELAKRSLAAYPNGLQIGGGVTVENAQQWILAGASHVIVTSWVFNDAGKLAVERLQQLVDEVGRDRIVLDLSCRRVVSETNGTQWIVATNRWQTLTLFDISPTTLDFLAPYAAEFLIHAADVEGLCQGIDRSLVKRLGEWNGDVPITYAGGVASMADVQLVADLSEGTVDVAVGSALDIFGGSGVRYEDLVRWNRTV